MANINHPEGPLKRFLVLVDSLVREIAHESKVLYVEKQYNHFDQEASFSIKVRFNSEVEVKPDVEVDGI